MVEKVEIDKRKSGLGFGINDCPLWLYKEFTTLAKTKFNDQYWVTLLDLFRKAEAYDAYVLDIRYNQMELPEQISVPDSLKQDSKKEEKEMRLFGGGC